MIWRRWNMDQRRAGRRAGFSSSWAASLLVTAHVIMGYSLDVTSEASVISVASDLADDMMSFYTGNQPGQTPGLLPQSYYWWEGGALMGALIDYWYYTGDSKWNDMVQQGLLFQVGPNNDYMPLNQTMTEGNDDQGFWGMAVLTAAEYNFPNPPATSPQWIALAQAVFNTQAARWDTTKCGGGLRWQIFQWNNGYDYKNSISQACFFNIAARLALYTRNGTYAAWANKTWDWMVDLGFMHEDYYYIYDGSHIETNCTNVIPYQWTYNAGAFLLGAAAMYKFTSDSDPGAGALWKERVDGLLNGTRVFFTGNDSSIMTEVACESVHLCDPDQQSFKAYLARWMAATTKWAPWTYDTVKPLLDASAKAAAAQCTGGDNGRMCGLMWARNGGKWDGTQGMGQQMAAMEVVLATMVKKMDAPVTNSTGGTSVGDPNAGSSDIGRTAGFSALDTMRPITTTDQAWAYILTVAALLLLLTGMALVFHDETGGRSVRERWRDLSADSRPGGVLRVWEGQSLGRKGGGEQEQEEVDVDRLGSHMSTIDLDGPSNVASKLTDEQMRPPTVTVSMYRSQGAELLPSLSRLDEYATEQPWRRPAREGGYAVAEKLNRGNGSGFGIIEDITDHSQPGSSTYSPTSGGGGSWRGTRGPRDLTKNLKLDE